VSDKEIVIFGAGKLGEKIAYQCLGKVHISCYWDNKREGELLGYQIKKPEIQKKCFIIVATMSYFEIREQLIQMGYCEFEDFIPYQIFQKKMAIMYGNCHAAAIKEYLERHKRFAAEYGFYPFPSICDIKKFKGEYHSILQKCDLFLHQAIRKKNKYGEEYSSENMLWHLNGNCEIVAIPNLYGRPKYLFPQFGRIDREDIWRGQVFYPFYTDSNVVYCTVDI